MKPRAELLNLLQAAGILTLALRISLNNSNHQKEKCASLVAPHCQHHTNLIGRERLEREIADLRDELDRVGGTPAVGEESSSDAYGASERRAEAIIEAHATR